MGVIVNWCLIAKALRGITDPGARKNLLGHYTSLALNCEVPGCYALDDTLKMGKAARVTPG